MTFSVGALWEWMTAGPLAWPDLLVAYVATFAAMILVAAVAPLSTDDTGPVLIGELTYRQAVGLAGVIAPVGEELIFRGLPVAAVAVTGLPLRPVDALVAGSVVWAFCHGRRWLVIVVSAPLYVRLWLAGPAGPALAILVHAGHNILCVSLVYWLGRVTGKGERGESLVAAVALTGVITALGLNGGRPKATTDAMTTDSNDYWTTEEFVADFAADGEDVSAERVERLLGDLEAEGIVRYEPDNGWYIPNKRFALAFIARHDPKLAAGAAANIMRDRLRPGGD